VIAAVAQVADTDSLNISKFQHNGAPAGHQILAGGDMLGAGIAGNAIIQGRKAAEAIHQHLYDVSPPPDYADQVVQSDDLVLGYYPDAPRTTLPETAPGARLGSLSTETHATLDEDAFFEEAARCMSCGACFGCSNCFMYCNADCYSLADAAQPGSYFLLDLSACEGCTKCIELCPSATIQ
jgi:Pyruvate/2-oxoacid:ferredoxin oxidoreductase delta subunit